MFLDIWIFIGLFCTWEYGHSYFNHNVSYPFGCKESQWLYKVLLIIQHDHATVTADDVLTYEHGTRWSTDLQNVCSKTRRDYVTTQESTKRYRTHMEDDAVPKI